MSINEIRDFIFESYYKRISIFKEKNYYTMKCLKKKRFILTCKQINRKNVLILTMLNNIINLLSERKTQNQ